jgi:hypothetical protein
MHIRQIFDNFFSTEAGCFHCRKKSLKGSQRFLKMPILIDIKEKKSCPGGVVQSSSYLPEE